MTPPLVSIGIPTYNRAVTLRRAIESAARQTYPNIEIIISDNASTDGTEALCREWAASSANIVYIRRDVNQGAVNNFLSARDAARGEYFLWLADDDWIDADYVERCAEFLGRNPDYVLAYGRDRYVNGSTTLDWGEDLTLNQGNRFARVITYFRTVDRNGVFYGLMRSSVARTLTFPDELAGDWLLMAQVVFAGRTMKIADTVVSRSVGGASDDLCGLAKRMGYPEAVVRDPWPAICRLIFDHLLNRTPALKAWYWPGRLVLAAVVAAIVYRKRCWPDRKAVLKRAFARRIGWRFRASAWRSRKS
jgi:glycosyltransferase involved in cell wall biosynthesis